MITEREKKLWHMLDDMETAAHEYKPEDSKFMAFFYKTVAKRHDILVSDGLQLYEPGEIPRKTDELPPNRI